MKKTMLMFCALVLLCATVFCVFVSAVDFDDISGHWAESVINKWGEKGIILGYEGKFRPDDFITRGDMAVIIDRIMKYTESAENTFSDLSDDAYYTEAVLKLNKAGIMLGADGLVRPTDNITREEAFVMFGRVYKFEKTDATPDFSDMDMVSDWAVDTISSMSAAGIVNGSDGKVNPKSNITRAEVLQILENISLKNEPAPSPTPEFEEEEEFEFIEPTKRPGSSNIGNNNNNNDNEGDDSGNTGDGNEGDDSGNTGDDGNEGDDSGNTGDGGNEGDDSGESGDGNEGDDSGNTGEGGVTDEGDAVLGEGEITGGIW